MHYGSMFQHPVRLLLALVLMSLPSLAANRYVRPGATGSNSGADWTNAYTSLPATLVRGDTYYLAAGNYGSYTFDDANSGTTTISIVKATPGAHGTNTGWSDSYGTGQAVFSHWNIYTDYYNFDGVTRNTDWKLGNVSQYGIKVAGRGPVRLDNASGVGGDFLAFTNIDFQGGGRDTGAGDDVIYGLTGNSNVTFRNCALHDSDRTIFLMRGNWRNLVVDHSYLARNSSSPATHGEILSMTDSTDVTFSNNIIEDPEGTAVWAGLNDGTASNWKIFGNVIFHSDAYRSAGREGISAVVFVANDSSNNNYGNNFLFYNNTVYQITGVWSGVVIQSGSGNTVQNNLWYNSTRTGGAGNTAGYNWYYNTAQDGDSSGSKQVCTSNCNIFRNAGAKDFSLTAATQAGATLAATYRVDPNGETRGEDGTWDRGAFEFSGTQQARPAPPTGVVAEGQ